jgi:hypothetical protein
MRNLRAFHRAAAVASLGLAASLWSSCSDHSSDTLTGPSDSRRAGRPTAQGTQAAIAAQERHTDGLLRTPGVVGTAVGLLANGEVGVRVFLARPGVVGLPSALDDVPVAVEVTGQFLALTDPTTRQRPAPVGFSVGHPAITAGSIGARVVDGSGNVYLLSNNHILANTNDASLGDPTLQPGPFDGGSASDQIGTLAAFKPIDFSASGANTIDAAIALSNTSDLGNATPPDDGYGTPSATIFGDANHDGFFDDRNALLGLNVQKYGRTTGRTSGQITGINATLTICYEVVFIFCVRSARFVDQLIIEPGSFSGGGDSGSLIVTADGGNNPVGLLFAGSDTQTIANRIDLVFNQFGVSVDDGTSSPPASVTDIAVTSVAAPASVTQGSTVDVVVTVRNVGNQSVNGRVLVTLRDVTGGVTIGTQNVPGLAVGATATRTFSWGTIGSALGNHTLTASHDFGDDNGDNDQGSTNVTVNAETGGMHVGDLDAFPSNNGSRWSATVEIAVHDASHNPLNGAVVTGTWSRSGLSSNTCTTGGLGGNGTCIVLFPSLRKRIRSVTFTVTGVTKAGETYESGANHDVDGSSNGTSIIVNKP